jgi:membrane-bound acyltransferase YfiQ involved in biofilm formation
VEFTEFAINLSENHFVVAVALLSIALLLLGARQKVFSLELDRKTGDVLRGFFILTVVLHHISQRLPDRGVLSLYADKAGYLSVAMFFLLSGYGLSASARPDTGIVSYALKRLSRVYVPCVLINSVLWLALSPADSLPGVLNPLRYDSTQWFVVTILIFYAAHFISTKAFSHPTLPLLAFTVLYIAGCFYLRLGSWWSISSLCFPLGCFWREHDGMIRRKLAKISTLHAALALTAVFLVLAASKLPIGLPFVLSPIFCLIVLLLTSRFSLQSKTLALAGACSFEIYILHMKLLVILLHILSRFGLTGSLWIVPYFVVLIASGYLFHRVNTLLAKILIPGPRRLAQGA